MALEALKRAEDLDSQLRIGIKEKGLFHRNVLKIRSEACLTLQSIFFLDYDLAIRKDLETILWKQCHYIMIDEFRKRYKPTRPGSSRQTSAEDKKEQRQLSASFRAFLNEANSFYIDFIHKMAYRFQLDSVKLLVLKKVDFANWKADDAVPTVEAVPVEIRMQAIQTCHRALTFLGDLARYRELYAEKSVKNWSFAISFYDMARRLCPNKGQPFNQLAVIDGYQKDDLMAVEHYLRSLMVKEPFQISKSNLEQVFRKYTINPEHANEKLIELAGKTTSVFLRQFTGLHSHIFGQNKNFSTFDSWWSPMMASFKALVESRSLDSNVLLKLFIINQSIFLLAQLDNKEHSSDINETLSRIVHLTQDMAAVLMDAAVARISRLSQGADSETVCRAVDELLPSIKICLMWMFIFKTKSPDLDWNMAKNERSNNFWRSLAEFLSNASALVPRDVLNAFPWEFPPVLALTEDIELAGFLPLQMFYQVENEANPVGCFNMEDVNDDEATRVRLQHILHFGRLIVDEDSTVLQVEFNSESPMPWTFSVPTPSKITSPMALSSQGFLMPQTATGNLTEVEMPQGYLDVKAAGLATEPELFFQGNNVHKILPSSHGGFAQGGTIPHFLPPNNGEVIIDPTYVGSFPDTTDDAVNTLEFLGLGGRKDDDYEMDIDRGRSFETMNNVLQWAMTGILLPKHADKIGNPKLANPVLAQWLSHQAIISQLHRGLSVVQQHLLQRRK
ncbi:hypothetical protein HDU76_003737 [Blyttiomyces sp. JEL0837]|nr:hypothetical protein HDU76_003737 [Blyttiomyces sp. JEL0837]